MEKNIAVIVLISVIIFGALTYPFAEKTTELYIPIGKSPGQSDKYNLIGRIDAVDPKNRTLAVIGKSETFIVQVVAVTQIFLDRSDLKQTSSYGTFSDFKPGMIVEVRFEANKYDRPAEWIKLQVDRLPK